MATTVQEFIGQLMPLYPELVVITIALTVLILDFFVDRKSKALLGWYSLVGIVIAAVMTVKLMGVSGSFFGGRSCSIHSRPTLNWPSILLVGWAS